MRRARIIGLAVFTFMAGLATSTFALDSTSRQRIDSFGWQRPDARSLYGKTEGQLDVNSAGYAGSAGYATTAGSATYSTTAGAVGYATTAGSASTANSANSASTAGYASTAGSAGYATSAGTATYSTTAGAVSGGSTSSKVGCPIYYQPEGGPTYVVGFGC